jgi:tryptophan-rich sensory protein
MDLIAYSIIIISVVAIAALGTYFTGNNLNTWYHVIALPKDAPSGRVIGIIWTLIYALLALSAMMVWNSALIGYFFGLVFFLIMLNGAINVFWTYVFFVQHQLKNAIYVSGILAGSVYLIILLLLPTVFWAGIILIPYALWTTYVTYLNYKIWLLNK